MKRIVLFLFFVSSLGMTFAQQDIGAVYLLSPSPLSAPFCPTASHSLAVVIQNYGVDNIDLSDFNTDVTVTVTGPIPQVFTVTVTLGNIAPGGQQSVPMPNVDISLPGNYLFTFRTDPTGGVWTDLNNANDQNSNNILVHEAEMTLTSAAGTDNQTVCEGSAITDITYDVGGSSTGATLTDGSFPVGVTGSYAGGTYTITGTPTEVGIFPYEITTTGGSCTPPVVLTGVISVDQAPNLELNNVNLCSPATTTDLTNPLVSSTDVGNLEYFTDAGFINPVADPTNVGAGTYYVRVTNGVCSDNGTVVVTTNTTPIITNINVIQPVNCGDNGTIEFTFSDVPDGVYTITHDDGQFNGVNVNGGTASVTAGPDTYNNLQITANTCTSPLGVNTTVTNPPTPTIIVSQENAPTTCGGNGSIVLTFTDVPDGAYTVNYGSGSFAGVNVNSNEATIITGAGVYEDLQITVNNCTSSLGVDAILSDPATPTIDVDDFTNPATCGGNGTIDLVFTDVPDGTYTINYDGDSFTGVVVSGNTATISTGQGVYEDLQITVANCTSPLGVDVTLVDPVTPQIINVVDNDPATCNGDGTIELTFTDVADGTYTIDYDGGDFPGVEVSGNQATINAPEGTYNNLTITINGCTSDLGDHAVLTDPPTPTLSVDLENDPLSCGINGSIEISTTDVPDGTYTIVHDDGTFTNVDITGNAGVIDAPHGTYTNITITVNGCTSQLGEAAVLNDPSGHTIAVTGTSNPATCGALGTIDFQITGAPDGTYTVFYNGGSFANVEFVGGVAQVSTGAGTYNDIQVIHNDCTSPAGVNTSLSDPDSPVIAIASIDQPTECGENGTINFTITNVPDGDYDLDYDGGQFENVTVTAGTASVVTGEGAYNNIQITYLNCTSDLNVNAVLTDPPTPTITVDDFEDPETCGANGTIDLVFTDVPDDTYTISYDGGTFNGVDVVSNEATIITGEGVYNNLQITIDGCTSALDVNVTLTDPPTPILTIITEIDPETCGGNGSIILSLTDVPDGTYTINYDGDNFPGVVVANDEATIVAPEGIYDNLQITINGCTSDLGQNAELTDPATPTLAISSIIQPEVCGGDGTINLTFTDVPDGVYNISYDGGSFDGYTVSGNTTSITAPEGVYNNLQITINGCTSALGIDAVLQDPETPEITSVTPTNPLTCGANGTIVFTFTDVPDGIYTINYDGGSFDNVNVNNDEATVSAPDGVYTNLQITVNGCTSDLGVNTTLEDPPTPTLTIASFEHPSECNGNGELVLNFTNVPDGTYTINYNGGNFADVVVTGGAATINPPAGSYNDIRITVNGCTSSLGQSVTLVDPPTPTITVANSENPETCNGNGSIEFEFTDVPDGAYTISYVGGTFDGVAVASNEATVSPSEGVYDDIQITINGCISALGVNVTLTDPATPSLTVEDEIDPTTCGGNGSIVLSLTDVPDGTYTINYDGGNFPGIVVTNNEATITTTEGIYSDLQITINGCTSPLGQDAVLNNPETPTLAISSLVQPSVCGGDGTINLTFTFVPFGVYDIAYDGGSFDGYTVSGNTTSINAPEGVYNDLQITINGCTSALGINAILQDPATPEITNVTPVNPLTCGANGTIEFVFTDVPNGTYTITHDDGTFNDVVVNNNEATVSAPAGVYTNIQITINECTSATGVNTSLSNPPTPTLTIASFEHPSECNGNGELVLNFTNVPDGTHTINYNGGNFADVVVAAGTTTINPSAGAYNDIRITVNGCTSNLGQSVTLVDPPTPTISVTNETDPENCGDDGIIELTFTDVPDGVYTINYDGGTFAGVTVTNDVATIDAPQGDYNDLQITINNCTNSLGINATLVDPVIPTISVVSVLDPAVCGDDGTVELSFTNISDGIYDIDYDGGTFNGVTIVGGETTINTVQGAYNNLVVTENSCASLPGVSFTLSDLATYSITVDDEINPATCGANGTIELAIVGLADGNYDITYDGGVFNAVEVTAEVATLIAPAGDYLNLQITEAGCTSAFGVDAILEDPVTPVLSVTAQSNPALCDGDGTITLNITEVVDGFYDIDFTGGPFNNVEVTGGVAVIDAPEGVYNDLQITYLNCTSDLGVNVTLTDPPTPTLTVSAENNPTSCEGEGSIVINFTDVPDGTYTISYDGGEFQDVVVTDEEATITASEGTYNDLQITINGCTSAFGQNATLTDPPIPVITITSENDPNLCNTDGFIEIAVTNVVDGTYDFDHASGVFTNVVVAGGIAIIDAPEGTYDDIQIDYNDCISVLGVNATLTDPPTPTLTVGVVSNPLLCGDDGTIDVTVTNVPDGNHDFLHANGVFTNVLVNAGLATIDAPQGAYTDIQITVNGCTSNFGENATLNDPALHTIIVGAETDAATCGGDGVISLDLTNVPDGQYDFDYVGGTFANVDVANDEAFIDAPEGVYNNIQLTLGGCTSAFGVDAVINDPNTPGISITSVTDPSECGGDGTIVLNLTNVANGTYTINYDGGSFTGVTVAAGVATVTTTEGIYNDLQLTINNCTSPLGVNATLEDPALPTVSVTTIDPAICGGDGTINFTFTNVVNGDYDISYTGGTFSDVTITGNTATVDAPEGTYNNLTITTNNCTNTLTPNAVLTDPATPTIALGTVSDPALCGADGSIGLIFTDVPNGNYTIDYDGGSFTGVTVANNTATINVPEGTYSDFQITVNGCTSNITGSTTLTDPITSTIIDVVSTNPTTCGGDGDITITFEDIADGTYDIAYAGGTFTGVIVTNEVATINAPAGTYEDFVITVDGCSSNVFGSVVLTDPVTPSITNVVSTDPSTCEGLGTITITFEDVSNGTYDVNYTGGSFDDVVVTNGATTVNAPAGTYENFVITIANCTSNSFGNVTLVDPVSPTIDAVTSANPTACGGNGEILISFSDVADGTYTVDYDGGNFTGVVVTNGEAVIIAPAGTYENFEITIANCTSNAIGNVTLQDPPTPTITLINEENPTECGGDGSIEFNFTDVADGTYTINYDGGSFTGVEVENNSATVTASEGVYENITITIANCTSAPIVSVELEDPETPDAPSASIEHPTCASPTGTIEIEAPLGADFEYSIDGGVNWSTDVMYEDLTPGETYTLLVSTVSSSNTCTAQEAFEIGDLPSLPTSVVVDVIQTTCEDSLGAIVFEATADVDYVLNGEEQANPFFDALAPGSYSVSIVSTIDTTCVVEGDAPIVINEAPEQAFVSVVAVDVTICVGSDVTLEVSEPDATYTYAWEFNDAEVGDEANYTLFGATFDREGVYTVLATNVDGCQDTAQVNLIVDACGVKVPKGFSPNNDGINDFFVVENLEAYSGSTLEIFNRWGTKVYESSDYLNDWDGRSQNGLNFAGDELPEGTYFYNLKLGGDPSLENHGEVLQGYVYIKR